METNNQKKTSSAELDEEEMKMNEAEYVGPVI